MALIDPLSVVYNIGGLKNVVLLCKKKLGLKILALNSLLMVLFYSLSFDLL